MNCKRTLFLYLLAELTLPTSTATTKHCTKIADPTSIISKVTENHLKLSTYETAVGTVTHISCLDEDLEVFGATTLTCLSSGQWDHDRPECKKKIRKPGDDINYKMIIGITVGVVCAAVSIISVICVIKRRQRNNKPTKHLDERLKKGKKKVYTEEMKTKYTEQETKLDIQPHVYKVWSYDRNVKKFITAGDYNDLKQKASKIFSVKDGYIYLEEDGTEIEDTLALESCKDKTLQIIPKNKEWYRDSIQSEVIDLRGSDNFGTIRSYHM